MQLTPDILLERRIWRHFNQGITAYDLLADGDRILVGLSGGKDSLALLDLLSRRARIHRPSIQVEALHVRMDNIDYKSDMSYLKTFTAERGIPLWIRHTTFDASTDTRKNPCFLCSWNRRKLLFTVAQERGCNKIALGHHQDDILHTTLLNLLYQGNFSTMPARLQMKKFPITIIRPLCKVQEADLQVWAQQKNFQKQIKLCPYESDSHRADMKALFQHIEQLIPEARYSAWNALEKANKLVEE